MTGFEEETVRRIGRYEVIRKIATGGMAELFLARFVGPGGFEKRCALKRILPQLAVDKTFTRMFLTEARVTAMFDHPNLVQIFELGQDEQGQFYIAMELVNGMNLRQLIGMCRERGQLVPPELASFMMIQALDGLAYAHDFKDEQGRPLHLVHRDVSPQNILVSYEGAVKIVDFGIVKGNSISTETQAGMLKGKVAYMSPEQASGEPIDARSDVFSVGVVLYELIAGEKPFTGANEIMCLKAILESEAPPITRYAPECPEGIEAIINRALAKEREDRFLSARQFQVELQEVLKTCPMPLGRHVVAEYLKSLTEGGTSHFDSAQVRIPRRTPAQPASVRFASSHGSVAFSDDTPEDTARAPTPAPAASAEVSDRELEEVFDLSTDPRERSRGGSGVTAELDAAGVGRMNPMILLVFAASALAGGLAVYLVTRDDRTVVIEVPSQPPTRVLPAEARIVLPAEPPAAVTRAPIEATEPDRAPPGLAHADSAQPAEVPPANPDAQVAATAGAEVLPEGDALPAGDAAPEQAGEPVREPAREPSREPAREPSREPAREPVKVPVRSAKRTPRAEPHPSHGTLTLTSTPRGLTVLDGAEVLGKTPLSGVSLPAGTHTLTLVHKALGISKRVTVRVAKGTTTAETITIGRGTLKVNSRPWSEVFVDGVAKGKTPLETPVYEGTHEVRLVSESGERLQKVEVEAGEVEDLRVRF